MVHIPTGLAVKCTEQRTQLANRAIALERLTAKLLVVLEEQQAAQLADIRGDVVKAEWGQQIRNYVFHPYKLVKDTRTGEGACPAGMLDHMCTVRAGTLGIVPGSCKVCSCRTSLTPRSPSGLVH